VMFISASKIFSYAGQRIALIVMSDKLYHRQFAGLEKRFMMSGFGNTVIYRALYSLSSGVTHSVQHAMAAMLKAANNGQFNFVKEVSDYGNKAHAMKQLFIDNGFSILYDKDIDKEIADGFYFTICYPGMKAGDLLNEILCYGISAITLLSTGSKQEGLRACVAPVKREQFPDLEKRLKQFYIDHPIA
jgi:aspartate/methionine/tyrosine aminotransferase